MSKLDIECNIEYNNNNMSDVAQVKEIRRQDLLDMSGLTKALDNNDLVILTNRGELDAVMARPSKLAEAMKSVTNKTASALRERMKQRDLPKPTKYDLAMMRAIHQRNGSAILADIGNDVQRATSNIHRRIQVLCERGLLVRVETGGSIFYRLTEYGIDILHSHSAES